MRSSITKTIRIRSVDLPYVEKVMKENELTWSGAIHQIIEGNVHVRSGKDVHVETEDVHAETIRSITSMLRCMGISYEGFLKLIDEGFTNGTLTIDGDGKLRTKDTDLRLEEFYEACHDSNVDPQKVVNTMTNNLRKGK